MVSFLQMLKRFLPMSKEKREQLDWVSEFTKKGSDDLKFLLKTDQVSIGETKFGSEKLDASLAFPVIQRFEDDPEVESMCDKWNEDIEDEAKKRVFEEFSKVAQNRIFEMIAPNIVGMEDVKEATMLQLFATDRVHILLLGDPGTGKTDILRSVSELAPKASFGLGSGTSGAGLTLAVKGKEKLLGLLPKAHKGLCCIDELNLMKDRDRAGLLNAMEKGFVTYDKGNMHVKEDADVKVLATANPKGDEFAGWIVETLKKQIPFDPALLTRFHLVFLIRKPDVEGFKEITKKIVSGKKKGFSDEEKNFVKQYVDYVSKLDVKFDKSLEPEITDFVEDIKKKEKDYLMDISPRLVVGVMRMSKAAARMKMKEEVEAKDLNKVLALLDRSLDVNEKHDENQDIDV